MAIWLGSGGGLRIERLTSEKVYAMISPADVDPGENRFGFDKAKHSLITGDLVSFERVNEAGARIDELLDFVDPSGWPGGEQHSDGQWYVNVDQIGGIRLYNTWRESLAGGAPNAVALLVPSESYRLAFKVVAADGPRCLAQTVSWELNTNREVADISNLGDAFRKNMALMVSGSGSVDALFDALPDACGEDANEEWSVYLHRLALRLEIGATFGGVFLLKRGGTLPLTIDEDYRPRELFYACDCVISQVATEVTTDDVIHSKIDFVTTGEIQLLFSQPLAYLLQEQPPMDRVLQESDFGIVLETVD